MVSYCSPSHDRILTKNLIENSNSPLKSYHNFFNRSQWIDGLDIWSSKDNIKKFDISKRNLDFHEDIGLYLPRNDKINSTIILDKNESISSKVSTNTSYPERLQQLFKKEKNLLIENNLNTSLSDEQCSSELEDNQPLKINSMEISSNRVRFPLRQIQSNNSLKKLKSKQIEQQNYQIVNREKLKILLKEQLNSLFTRETTNLNQKRTLIKIPSVVIKHQNYSPKTTSSTDTTLVMERYAKLQQLLMSPPLNQTKINNKIIDNRQSPLIFNDISTFGLTVTPLDFSSGKHLENCSLEKISQEDKNFTLNRSSTQPVLRHYSINQNEEKSEILLKRQFEKSFVSSSGDFIISDKNSIEEQTQTIRKFYRHHRSSSKNPIQRTKTFDLLPPVISGKRLHIPISNNRHS